MSVSVARRLKLLGIRKHSPYYLSGHCVSVARRLKLLGINCCFWWWQDQLTSQSPEGSNYLESGSYLPVHQRGNLSQSPEGSNYLESDKGLKEVIDALASQSPEGSNYLELLRQNFRQ